MRALLRDQLPERADGALQLVGNGWDNVIYRLDDDCSIRLPRREVAAGLVLNEQRWLPVLAPRLPLPIPVPVHAGRATEFYPWRWSVGPWFAGERASVAPPDDLGDAAVALADFVTALHTPAADDAPVNPVRGGSHAPRLDRITGRIEMLGAAGGLPDHVGANDLVALWHELAATPDWNGPPLWLHGDLHASNILTADGRLSAVIDFGDITGGDPATDLAVAWILFDAPSRERFQALIDRDEHTWRRAKAWALSFAIFYLDARADDAAMGRMGDHTLAQVLGS
ncbi:MAG: aminoglycoside phosphotransferase [Ilumatobacteraceae bacterium]|nr:aminoglycoside phosphotransferase [Ilumatobacteraceae bacterium]